MADAESATPASPVDVATEALGRLASELAPGIRADGEYRQENLLALAWRDAVLARFARWTTQPEYPIARRLCREAKPWSDPDSIVAADAYLLETATPVGDVGAVFAMMAGCRPLWLLYWTKAWELLEREALARAESEVA